MNPEKAMTLEQDRKLVDELYARVGIRTDWTVNPLPSGFMYDNFEVSCKEDFWDPYMAVHDLAHFLIALPERRGLPNFGLGPAPHGNETEGAPEVVTPEESSEDESRASVLHIALLLKYLPKGAEPTSRVISVDMDKGAILPCKQMDWLRDQGHVDENNIAVF